MGRGLLLLCALVLQWGCLFRRAEILEARMAQVAAASGGLPTAHPRLLHYEVEAHDGHWEHAIVSAGGLFAERRTRADGVRYAFGVDAQGSWLAIADRAAVIVEGDWALESRARAALHQMRFARPDSGSLEEIARDVGHWELAHVPVDGQRLALFVDRSALVAREVDMFDPWARVQTCAALDWGRAEGGAVIRSSNCGTSNLGDRSHGRTYRMHSRLARLELLDDAPSWAMPERSARAASREPATFSIQDERRIALPVQFGDAAAPVELLLDTGAFHTVLTPEVAARFGVIPTGEAPIYIDPPWLPSGEDWVGVVDVTRVGSAEVHGQRVLVAAHGLSCGGVGGLIGRDLLRHFVVDIDTPHGEVRLWEHGAFDPPAHAKRLPLRGLSARIRGEVDDVARGDVLLDSGVEDNIVVHAPMMAVRHPRHRSDDAFLGAGDTLHSPDYHTEIRGVHLGPFAFPRMSAVGRDRERDKVGGGIAIAGMGLMRYLRLAFDYRHSVVHASAGDAFTVLHRLGFDLEDGVLGLTIDRVVPRSPADGAGLQAGDVLLAIEKQPVAELRDTRRRLATHRRSFLHLVVERRMWLRTVTLDLLR